jgi:tetratricopeptide (TPR) repeat protein
MRSMMLLVTLAATAAAQTPDSLRADSAFRRRDWGATKQLYATIAQQSSSQGMAWLRLGIARQALNELDSAIVAYDRALALQFQVPTATYRLARVHALKGNIDKAFTYLDQLAPMNAIPVALLDTLSELATVRKDPRYAKVVERMNAARFPCRGSREAHQLDFWIGDWVVTPWQAPPGPNLPVLGTNRIEPLLEQCALLENWTGTTGGNGKSINFYDTNRLQWRQVWVADGGGSLDYAGTFRNGAMRFEGWTLAPNGERVLQKLTFFPIAKDTVRQLFETSNDSGKTWQSGFDGRYARRKP